jgi:hypothetical protein
MRGHVLHLRSRLHVVVQRQLGSARSRKPPILARALVRARSVWETSKHDCKYRARHSDS